MAASLYNTLTTPSVYKIDYSRPGVVVIFNNKVFTEPIKYPVRHGSEKDVYSKI